MKVKNLLIKASLLSLCMVSQAYASADLAKSKNCMACHAMDKKLVGPGFSEIKEKYEKDSSAVDKLSAKVKKGGSGVWGPIPMPANTQVSEAEAKVLVKWILGK